METTYKEIESLTISSDIQNLHQVESLIESVCKEKNVQEEFYGNILIAVTEAVNNAIQHGNKNNLSKHVFVSASIGKNSLQFVVKDEGNGFDYNSLPDPTLPENIDKESGRGIFLMNALSDQVIIENNGTKVILIFDVSND